MYDHDQKNMFDHDQNKFFHQLITLITLISQGEPETAINICM